MLVAVPLRSAIDPHPDPNTSPTAGVPAERSRTARTAARRAPSWTVPQASDARPASGREDDFPDDLAPGSEWALELAVEHHADPTGVAERQRQPLLGLPPDAVAGIQQRFLGSGMVGLHLGPAPLDGLDVQDHLLPVVGGDALEWQHTGKVAFDLERPRRETGRGLARGLGRFRRRRRRGWYLLGGGGERLGFRQTFGPVAVPPDEHEQEEQRDADHPNHGVAVDLLAALLLL